jgi:solute carrier family 35, member C2
MNPANGVLNTRTSRPRGQSILNQANLLDEPKISEEDSNANGLRRQEEDGDLSDEDLHDDEETGLTKKDKHRKQKKRRRNTLLDNRIAKDKITAEERKEADKNVMKRLLVNGCLILLWYIFSLSISLVSLLLRFFAATHPG